jgi:hypothetical protein
MVVFYSSIVTYSWLTPTHGCHLLMVVTYSWLSPTRGCHLLTVVTYSRLSPTHGPHSKILPFFKEVLQLTIDARNEVGDMTIAVATECRRVTDLLIEERDDALRERDEARRNQNGRRNR